MRIILGVALLALCALGKEEETTKDEKSDVTKRGFVHSLQHNSGHDFSQTFNQGLNGAIVSPQTAIDYGTLGHSNLYSGVLNYGRDFGYALGHTHHGTPFPRVAIPEVITRTVTVDKPFPIPQAVPIRVDRPVSVPVAVPQPYPVEVKKAYPVEFEKPVAVPVEREVPYTVLKPVPYPVEQIVHYPVEKRVYYPVHIPVERRYTVNIPKPYPVYQEKTIPYPVERLVHVPVPVKVNVPVPQPVPVPVERPYAVKVPHPVPVTVERRVPVTVHKPVPVPIVRKVAVPFPHPVPFHVEKHVPIPVTPKFHIPSHVAVDGGSVIDVRHDVGAFDQSFNSGILGNSHLKSSVFGSQLEGRVGNQAESFFNGGILPSTEFSHLLSSQSFGTDGLSTFDGTIVSIDKSVEIPMKVHRSATDKLEAEAKASEPLPVKVKKEENVNSD